MRTATRTITVLLFVVLAAPAAVVGTPMTEVDRATTAPPPDPEQDVIGWENGYWHNESIDVDQSDGLTERELEAYVSRSMARVEHIREREFKQEVPVTALTRPQFRLVSGFGSTPPPTRAWQNQVWEAMFIVNEPNDAVRQQRRLSGSRIGGLYIPAISSIFIISDSPRRPVIDNATLVHELTHALQDQHFGLDSPSLSSPLMDVRLGQNGLTEGEANYVEARYEQRCEVDWDCVETPGPRPNRLPYGGGDLPNLNIGIQVSQIQPYSDGPAYVHSLVQRDGWDAVEAKYANPPRSTGQIIHPNESVKAPTQIGYDHAARNGWKVFGKQGRNGYETVGEAGIYSMFWYQGRAFDRQIIPWRQFQQSEDGEYDTFNYTSVPSEGWENDRLYPYRKGDDRGYVWKTKWETRTDAAEFHDAYLQILDGYGAVERGPNTWVIPSGGFADAFRIVQEGDTVIIVNGPNVEALDDIRPSANETAAS